MIASISLGQTRNFGFRKKIIIRVNIAFSLPYSSLFIVNGDQQEHWEHRIAKSISSGQL
ncbi:MULTISPECIES: alpha-ketoglutarate-dependent dioxygenase AlkB [Elizabethkingia]|uniref:Alkylated DNA repair protein alkB n=1 Tax=Elizabethkingia anophelis TaxID=1117645 RepID=A0A455ZEE8_9FLAO|nr:MULTISPECIES: alpha-ketoglutarate-dependent dioxygenase AlkB [Elizabethkingia]EHM7981741.1 alpha-ketoglutarate-dependent dioxygenase AlkB [Elizabethkingia anophelis]EHM8032239.1 alpha-ketoglutarate-dependent dioxygenase AlkB [Elizabethkingia anophelis]EHZ9535193.1 alpha-ketoglutarate-dependent dioxygenase AlkB [Elizabethkingia anophelis]EKU3673103.1 alpha-ketoglutarate-dependent dioxygenase AlkB [Elizabethkingia anophelis]EKU4210080.1 alpha-ketoglutarate-dependent dioxygenase AlkB [Elizabet